jgi:LacI family transcriptional regulator, galactose operon repressor
MGGSSDQRVTMAAIARAAGVSVPTVSRVVNGRGGVAGATRERIERLLSQHEYRARSSPHSGLVQVVFPEIDCTWETEHLAGIEAGVRDAGARLVVSALNGRVAAEDELVRRLRTGHADGVILAAATGDHPMVGALESLRIPAVALDPAVTAAREMPTVGASNWSGARSATAHLLALGHRRIAMIAGSKVLECSSARLAGYLAALDEAGVAEDPVLVETSDYEFASGFAAARRLLEPAEPPTAIFASSDNIALGVYEAARLRGLSIPEQLSVVGFDDLPVAGWMSPPLTTVRQPLQEMGRLAARTVLRLAGRETVDYPHVELSTTLVVRHSTATPHG